MPFQAILVILAAVGIVSAQNFKLTCVNYKLNRNVLSGYCRKIDELYTETSISLSLGISNDNGSLIWEEDGKYAATCEGCRLQPDKRSVMGCLCQNSNRDLLYTEIDLNDGISNINGELEFSDNSTVKVFMY